jgi:hypothetical protein
MPILRRRDRISLLGGLSVEGFLMGLSFADAFEEPLGPAAAESSMICDQRS